MNTELIVVYIIGYVSGILASYIRWAPHTPFKSGMISFFTFGKYR